MKLIEIEQGSPAWLDWRKSGVTATDIVAIMGQSPYATKEQLFMRKIGAMAEQASTFAMNAGKELEPKIRALVEEKMNCTFSPVCVEHEEHVWARASLDGLSADTILEIKYNNKDNHASAMKQLIPQPHYTQMQWQLFVSGLKNGIYASYNNDDLRILTVAEDKEYQKNLFDHGQHFYNCLTAGIPPESPISEDIKTLFEEYEAISNKIDSLTERLEEIKGLIRDITPDDKTLTWGQVTGAWRARIGSVQYDKIEVLKGIDLNKYRKEPTKYFEVRVKKNATKMSPV